jgi:hypothetical protein
MPRIIALVFLLTALPILAADLSGFWEFEVDLGGIEIETNCTLTQKGTELSGRCWATSGPYRYDTEAVGVMAGDRLELAYSFPSDRGKVTFRYKGTREEDGSISGDLSIVTGDKGDTAKGLFSAAKTR